jgi:hypothetical protein
LHGLEKARREIQSVSYGSLLLQIRWADPSLPYRVVFGGLRANQPLVRVYTIEDLYKLALLQNKGLLVSTAGAAVGSGHVDVKGLVE